MFDILQLDLITVWSQKKSETVPIVHYAIFYEICVNPNLATGSEFWQAVSNCSD